MTKKIIFQFLILAIVSLNFFLGDHLGIQAEEQSFPRGTEIAIITQIVNPNGSSNGPDAPGEPYVDVSVEVVECHPEGTQFDVVIDGITRAASGLAVSPETTCAGTYRISSADFNLSNGAHTVLFSGTFATTYPPREFYVINTPPPPAIINVTPDRYMSWSIDGSPYLCSIAACSGSSSVSYSFDASGEPSHTVSAYGASENVVSYSFSPIKNLASKLFGLVTSFVTASSGSGATCHSTPGGSCSINLNTTYCTVNIVGYWNGSGNIPTNASYNISGASNASGTNSSGTNSHTLIADPGGTSYTFGSSGFTGTVNGYSSDVYASDSVQTCFPGSTITFNITSQSKPILDVR